MNSVRSFLYAVVVAGMASVGAGSAAAQPPMKPPAAPMSASAVPPLVGIEEVARVTAPSGFIDEAIVLEGDRFAYVLSDSTTKSELHVMDLTTKTETVVDISKLTLAPVALRFIGKARMLVIGQDPDGRFSGGGVELAAVSKAKPAGFIAYKLAPATHLTVIQRDGKPRIAAMRESTSGAVTRYEVELLALDTGKRVGAQRTLELEGGVNQKLGFTVNHWSDGWTKAGGIRAGEWDKKENQQTPKAEATYDLVTGKLGPRVAITDLFEQRRRFTALAESNGVAELVRWGWDNTSLQLWAGGKFRVLELDQPVGQYDKATLQGVVAPDGSAWLALKVDPVNQAAVTRQKADTEYFDVFRVGPGGDTHAVRKGRLYAKDRRFRIGAAIGTSVGDTFFVLEKNQGFDRGGKAAAIYRPL